MHYHLQKIEFLQITYFRVFFYSDRQWTPLCETSRLHLQCKSNTGTRRTGLVSTAVRYSVPPTSTDCSKRRPVSFVPRNTRHHVVCCELVTSAAPATGYESNLVHQTPNCKQQFTNTKADYVSFIMHIMFNKLIDITLQGSC